MSLHGLPRSAHQVEEGGLRAARQREDGGQWRSQDYQVGLPRHFTLLTVIYGQLIV